MVGAELFQQAVVVGDGDHAQRLVGVVGERLHPAGAVAQGVDVQARIQLVEDRELRPQHRQLQRLVALLLAAGQIHVERPVEERRAEADALGLTAERSVQPVGAAAAGGERLAHHVGQHHAGHLAGVLHHQVQAGLGTTPRRQGQHVLAVQQHLPAEHLVAGATHHHGRQGGLAGAVGAHDRVHLAGADGEVDPVQDLLAPHRSNEPLDLQSVLLHVAASIVMWTMPSTTRAT